MTRQRPRTGLGWALLIAGIAAAVFAVGCGGDDAPAGDTGTQTSAAAGSLDGLSADQVLEKAKATAAVATSVTIAGSGQDAGSDLNIDVTIADGTGSKGTVNQDGVQVQFVAVGDRVYMKLNQAGWTKFGGEEAAKAIGDKWLSGPASDERFAPVRAFTDLGALMNEVLTPEGKVTRADGKEIDGTKTVALKDGEGGSGGILYIADEGDALPLQVEPASGEGTVTFRDWNTDQTIEAPSQDETIDVTKLPS